MKKASLTAISLLFCGTLALAQQGPAPASQPQENGELFSSDLVAWTIMQQPQTPEHKPGQTPAPDPQPDTQPSQSPTTSQPPSTPPGKQSQSQSQNESPTAQTFIGVVSKGSGNFELRVSASTSYKLDNQEQVQQYEGQRVRMTGTLERSMNLIHVDRIEPIS